MKSLILSLLFIGQFVFALSLTDTLLNAVSTSAPDLCKKLALVDRSKCADAVNGKQFRREFVSVCEDAHKKFKGTVTIECLEAVADKRVPQASKNQAEVCGLLIKSNDSRLVLKCLNSNVTGEFSTYCSRYLGSDKHYSTATECMHYLSDLNETNFDMKHFVGCQAEAITQPLSKSIQCLINAERKVSGEESTIIRKLEKNTQQ